MYATPLPLGWAYKAYSTDGLTYLPNSAATFYNWPQQIYRPVQIGFEEGTGVWRFMSLGAVIALLQGGSGGVLINPAHAVYDSDGNLSGYMVYVVEDGEAYQLPPTWWGPVGNMRFVTFPDVATDGPHGYPVGEGMFRGYFDAPTVDGITRCWGNYWKDHNGVLLRLADQSDPLPPYCSYYNSGRNPARVILMADFPGRAAVPGVPEISQYNGFAGWNSGATSVDAFEGNCRVTFTPSMTAAVTVGLTKSPRPSVVVPEDISHAFRFDAPEGGLVRTRVVENGLQIGQTFSADADAVFVIERIDGVVEYKVDDAVVHTSELVTLQTLCVGACLYYGGDGVY